MSVGTERGWVGRMPVPQIGFPCGMTLVSDVSNVSIVSVVSVVSIVSIVSIVSVVSVLKKPT